MSLALCAGVLLRPAHASAPASIGDTDWPMYQHDVRHTGRSSLLGITAQPKLRWKRQLVTQNSGVIGSNMSIGPDGTIYVAAFGHLYALDPRDGASKWTTTNQPGQSYSTATVAADGRLYWGFGNNFAVISPNGEMVGGLDALDSNMVSGGAAAIGPDGSVYYNHEALWALTSDGELRWVHQFSSWFSHSSPVIGPDGTIYASSGFGEGVFYAFAPDGTIKWRGSIGAGDTSASIGDDGTIYVPSGRTQLAAYAPDGTLKWLYTTNESTGVDANIPGSPAIGQDGSLYFSAATSTSIAQPIAHIYALTRDGALRWKIAIPSGMSGSMMLDRADNLYGCDYQGTCYAIDAQGKILWKYTLEAPRAVRTTPLIVADDSIWIIDELGTIYALDGTPVTIFMPIIRR